MMTPIDKKAILTLFLDGNSVGYLVIKFDSSRAEVEQIIRDNLNGNK